MSDQPIKRGRGASTFDRPDQPLIGGAKATEPPKEHARNVRFNPMLKFGEKLAGARQFSREEVPAPALARSPSRGHKTTKIEPKSSPLARAPPPSRVGPSLPPITTTTKRPRSSPGSPSPRKKVRVESPPTASASTSLATDPALSTTTTNNNDNDSAGEQPLPVALTSVRKRRLVDYLDSEDE